MFLFFKGRATGANNRKWIVSVEDLRRMYSLFQPGDDIVLWCDGSVSNQETATCTKNKYQAESDNERASTSKRAKKEEEIDKIRDELKEKHGDKFSAPWYELWARLIVSGQRTSRDVSPSIPLFGSERSKPTRKKKVQIPIQLTS